MKYSLKRYGQPLIQSISSGRTLTVREPCVGGQLHQLVDAQVGRRWRQMLRFLSAPISGESGQVPY